MNRHVEQVAGTGFVFVLPPAPAGLVPVQKPLAAKVARLAESSRLHQVSHVAHRRSEAVRERGHVPHAFVTCSAVHLGRLLEVQAERFFAHDVLTVLDTGQRLLAMDEIRRRHDDRIDVRVGRDVLVVR